MNVEIATLLLRIVQIDIQYHLFSIIELRHPGKQLLASHLTTINKRNLPGCVFCFKNELEELIPQILFYIDNRIKNPLFNE